MLRPLVPSMPGGPSGPAGPRVKASPSKGDPAEGCVAAGAVSGANGSPGPSWVASPGSGLYAILFSYIKPRPL